MSSNQINSYSSASSSYPLNTDPNQPASSSRSADQSSSSSRSSGSPSGLLANLQRGPQASARGASMRGVGATRNDLNQRALHDVQQGLGTASDAIRHYRIDPRDPRSLDLVNQLTEAEAAGALPTPFAYNAPPMQAVAAPAVNPRAALFRQPQSIDDAHGLLEALGNATHNNTINLHEYRQQADALMAYVHTVQRYNPQNPTVARSSAGFVVTRAETDVRFGAPIDAVMQQYGFHPNDLGMRRRLEAAQGQPEESPFAFNV
jgi:hypothetical protein